MSKTVITTGVSGQLGSYLSDFLIESGYKVIGTKRRASKPDYSNLKNIKDHPNFRLEEMDLSDPLSIKNIIKENKPDFFVNCAANSFVGTSWKYPVQHIECNSIGVLHQLEAIKDYSPHSRYLNFGSSEEFGDVQEVPQTERTELRARSPYGVSKITARQLVKVYKESFGLFAMQPWCFNYESPRRGKEFISKKITTEVARIYKEIKSGNERPAPLVVGNILAKRDWSHAKDTMRGVWSMLNQPEPNNYVFSSNETHSVKELIDIAFKKVGINLGWGNMTGACWSEDYLRSLNEEELLNVSAFKSGTTVELVKISKEFFRPCEVSLLHGDSSLARKELGWKPEYSFEDLINEMMEHDLNELGLSLEND